MQIKRKNLIILLAALWALAASLDGCGFITVSSNVVIDEPFTEDKVRMISHGETTKKEILEWFGPPVAVARPGTVMKVPHWSKNITKAEDVPADDFFKRFTASREQAQAPLAYYYEAASLSWTELYGFVLEAAGPLYIPSPENRPLTVRKLWILFDEKSEKVVDHQVEKMIEGKLQQETPKKPVINAVGVEIP